MDPERRFYDFTTSQHHHFYNADTGELSDVAFDNIEIAGLLPLPPGTALEGAEFIIRVRNTVE